ncbi:MAG: hypothetical protein ABFD92_04215 [Planctomycetaceae bacterium]|nr:hypothetical protein [Planctomycetaceae bacterium]
MSHVARVLKRDTFQEASPCPVQQNAAPPGGAAAGHPVQARIIEHGERMAVVEVLCQCGHKIILHCLTSPAARNTTEN